ncbi:MAG: hypothetical protein DVB25_05370 [Verrucomicrobia bacterium]|nr:MAG: hypothetical protein DVB25_05370 [Verrucomicrobiota bacterium]
MSRSICQSVAAYALGSALAAAAPAPPLVAAVGFPAIAIPATTTLKLAAPSIPPEGLALTALAFDEKGRVYIAESPCSSGAAALGHQPPAWYLDDLAVHTPADRLALVEKWRDQLPQADPAGKLRRVRRLTDADGDGVFEKSTTLAGGFDAPLGGVFAYEGGVYLAALPKLSLLPETNGNAGAATLQPLLDGFGLRFAPADHALHGFTLGPDGRLYGTMGDRGLCITTKDGKTAAYPNQGCAFRVETDGTGFEVFHTGLRNPRGIAFDALGNAFTVEAASGLGEAARLIYLVEGGDSGWRMEYQTLHDFHQQIGLPEAPPNPWSDGHMGELQHELQPAYILPPAALLTDQPLGLTVHPGTGLLEAEAGRLLICQQAADAVHSGIDSYHIETAGAGMQLRESRPLLRGLVASAAQFAWDGRLYFTAAGDPSLYALDAGSHTWRNTEAATASTLNPNGFDLREAAELAVLLRHPDARIRLHAQIALTRLPDALLCFVAATESTELLERVHGIWGLGILARRGAGSPVASHGGFGAIPDNKLSLAAGQHLAGLLKHPDPETRAQAARAIGDAQNQFTRPRDARGRNAPHPPSAFITAAGLPLASLLIDESPRVRYFAAISIGKLKGLAFYGPICDFLKANNNSDAYLRHAGTYALQHLATHNPALLTSLEQHPAPAVRLAATVALRRMHEPATATFIHDADVLVADEAIRAITDLSLDEVRGPLADLLDKLAARPWQPFMLRRLIHNAFRLGTAANAARLLKLVGDPAIPVPIQHESLRLLALWREPPPVDQLTGCWRPLAKREAAEMTPVLSAALPRLLKLDGFIRSAALDLAKQYQIPIPSDFEAHSP